jgi:hypothetical protein
MVQQRVDFRVHRAVAVGSQGKRPALPPDRFSRGTFGADDRASMGERGDHRGAARTSAIGVKLKHQIASREMKGQTVRAQRTGSEDPISQVRTRPHELVVEIAACGAEQQKRKLRMSLEDVAEKSGEPRAKHPRISAEVTEQGRVGGSIAPPEIEHGAFVADWRDCTGQREPGRLA